MNDDLARELGATCGAAIKSSVSGARLCTFAIGGPLELVVEPGCLEDLLAVVHALRTAHQPFRVLGAGSNVLIPSDGLSGCTVKLGRGFRRCEPQGNGVFVVGGSASLMTLSRELSDAGFSGLEFAGGIPASIGGAIRMNAGAHGGEVAAVLRSVSFVTASGDVVTQSASELSFEYRRTSLPESCIVFEAELKLMQADPQDTMRRRRECLDYRKRTQPLTAASAGSVFRNPSTELPAGKVIEELGLRGTRRGGAVISELHGNWIINEHRLATSEDVSALIALCQQVAREKFDLELVPELVRW